MTGPRDLDAVPTKTHCDEGVLGWHLLAADRRLGYDDGREVVDGTTLEAQYRDVYTNPTLCEAGMHASTDIMDALPYAPGPIICRVRVGGPGLVMGKDKLTGDWRKCIWSLTEAQSERVLRRFARWSALTVAHSWDSPDEVMSYLVSGSQGLRKAASGSLTV